jgi:hypothetical protein
VPDPKGAEEDDGVLLSVVLDSEASKSFLLVVDARTMQEMGRADLPHHVPFSLGGEFFPREELKQVAEEIVASTGAGLSVDDFYAAIRDLPDPEPAANTKAGWMKRLGR